MHKIAIYGKGGVGKSVVATSLSAYYALSGKRVFHVGCDPKTDSSVRLMDNHIPLKTVLDALGEDPAKLTSAEVVNAGRLGIDCCESGGPSPGQGCGGRGVARTLEFLDEMGLFSNNHYDVVLFDVLGDVVCGGFAAPLRYGFARKVFIVVSEEPMSLFAANNISKAILTYADNGLVLGGLIANLRNNTADRDALHRFAEKLRTRIVEFIPRDELIQEAERRRKTIVEHDAASDTAAVFRRLGDYVLGLDEKAVPLPTPMSDDDFFSFVRP